MGTIKFSPTREHVSWFLNSIQLKRNTQKQHKQKQFNPVPIDCAEKYLRKL
jgi:hypothetical protein